MTKMDYIHYMCMHYIWNTMRHSFLRTFQVLYKPCIWLCTCTLIMEGEWVKCPQFIGHLLYLSKSICEHGLIMYVHPDFLAVHSCSVHAPSEFSYLRSMDALNVLSPPVPWSLLTSWPALAPGVLCSLTAPLSCSKMSTQNCYYWRFYMGSRLLFCSLASVVLADNMWLGYLITWLASSFCLHH